MSVSSVSKPALGRDLLCFALMNGASVSTLYWAQSLVMRAGSEFGPSLAVRLMPGATLAGYAVGVALLAAVVRDLTSPIGLVLHVLILTAGLCTVATAPGPGIAAAACLVIGLGCSLTQRLLASATSVVAAEARSATIGWIIATGLFGIVLARACVPMLADRLGWRGMFWIDAMVVTALGLGAAFAAERGSALPHGVPAAPATTLWRRERMLRSAALQQALVFAAFNLGWALFPRLLAADGLASSVPMGLVASLGASAAILSGRLCARWDPTTVARSGLLAAMAAAAILLATVLLGRNTAVYLAAMAMLDVGTQVALVSNQTRAQALASSPAMRGRVTAIVTTIGFGGGASGAALGNLIG